MKKRIFPYLALVLIVILWMTNWSGDILPLNLREENVNDLSYFHLLIRSVNDGTLFSTWNPLALTGNTNQIQRGFFLLAPLALLTKITHANPGSVYVMAVGITFFLSGIGLYEYLRMRRLTIVSALTGASIYIILPPHLTLGLDVLDFNVFWALIPWMCVVIEYYIYSDDWLRSGIILGFLSALGLIAGTTYFIAVLPFIVIFSWLNIYVAKKNSASSQYKLLVLLVMCLLGLTSYLIIPIIAEYKHLWISVESQRKRIFNILSFYELGQLFWLRLTDFSPLSWKFDRNHPDFGFYLGWTVLMLTLPNFFKLKSRIKTYLPCIFLLLSFFGFISLRFVFVHQLLKNYVLLLINLSYMQKGLIAFLILGIVGIFLSKARKSFSRIFMKLLPAAVAVVFFFLFLPRLQGVYDQTIRMFLLPTLALSILAAYGFDILLKFAGTKFRKKLMILTVLLIFLDLYPFHVFFHAIPLEVANRGQILYKLIDYQEAEGRYWAPFPFRKHLPKYRYEYLISHIDRSRLNNENIYTPFTPLYSTELYDVTLVGAVEQNNIDLYNLRTILDWGFSNYIVLNKNVHDYKALIEYLQNSEWSILEENQDAIALINNNPSEFFKAYSSYADVPNHERRNLSYWFMQKRNGIAMYDKHDLSSDIGTSISEPDSDAKITSWKRPGPTHFRADLETTVTTLLVASEAWYPGWHATLDGQPTEIVRANYASLGTFVPSGKHTVTFTYIQPWYYVVGRVITVITMIVSIIFIGIKNRQLNH